jgi:hypothetical protein
LRLPAPPARAAAAGLAALLALVAAMTVAPVTNNDVFLHLTTGRLVVETGRVPRVDDYSALARGRPFVAHEWLAGVVFHLAHRAAGWGGLVALKLALAAGLASILYAAARGAGAAAPVALPALALAMVLAGARLLERPHLFTYLGTAAFLLVLARRQTGRPAPLWILPGIQVLWANLHGGFILGPLVAGLAAAAKAIDGATAEARRLAILVPVLIAACVINPYGPALLKFPFALTGSAFMDLIYEWLPPYAPEFAATYMARLYAVWTILGGGVLAAAALRRLRGGPPPPGGAFPFLVFAAFFALSLRMNRNVTDFALATVPGVAACATALLGAGRGDRRARALLPAWILVFLALTGWMAARGYPYAPGSRREPGAGLGRSIPVAAADYLQANGVRGNVFTDYASGAYLVFRFYPEVRVAMDSRNDVYGEALYREYQRATRDPEALRRLLDRIEAAAIFLQWPVGGMVTTAAVVRDLGSFRPVYFDDAAVIYLDERGPHAALARRDGYRILDPSLFRPGSVPAAAAALAVGEAARAVERSGGAFIARVMRADALLAAGRRAEGLAEEAAIAAADPPLHHIHIHLGLIRLAAGDPATAAARFRRALALNPRSPAARAALERATAAVGPPATAPTPGNGW